MSDKKPTCQYCLADSRFTTITMDKDRRCPVCGSDYIGPRRNKEYAVLLEAGLIADDENKIENSVTCDECGHFISMHADNDICYSCKPLNQVCEKIN